MKAADLNAAITDAHAVTRQHEDALAVELERIIVQAGYEAARNFQKKSVSLTATAGWSPPQPGELLDEQALNAKISGAISKHQNNALKSFAGNLPTCLPHPPEATAAPTASEGGLTTRPSAGPSAQPVEEPPLVRNPPITREALTPGSEEIVISKGRVETTEKVQKAYDEHFFDKTRTAATMKNDAMVNLAAHLTANPDFNAQYLLDHMAFTPTGTGKLYYGDSLEEDAVANLIHSWAATSGDSNAEALFIQEMARQEFGLADYLSYSLPEGARAAVRLDRYRADPILQRSVRAFLRVMYRNTQERFQQLKIEHVTLVRGLALDREELNAEFRGKTGEVSFRHNPLSSWSISKAAADDFAQMQLESMDQVAATIFSDVPTERIISSPATGFGCLDEGEFVVLGPPGGVTDRAFVEKYGAYAEVQEQMASDMYDEIVYGNDDLEEAYNSLTTDYGHDEKTVLGWMDATKKKIGSMDYQDVVAAFNNHVVAVGDALDSLIKMGYQAGDAQKWLDKNFAEMADKTSAAIVDEYMSAAGMPPLHKLEEGS